MYSNHARQLMCKVYIYTIPVITNQFRHAMAWYSVSSLIPLLYYTIIQAYEQGILYPRYLFLFYGWYSENWWVGSENENLTCSQEDREEVIKSGLAIVFDESITDCSQNISTGIVR